MTFFSVPEPKAQVHYCDHTLSVVRLSVINFHIFSAPEPKAQVHYCDHALSVVRRPSVVNFSHFDYSSETTEQNSMKLDRKQELNILYQVCVFRVDRKTRWPLWPLIG